MSDPVKYLSVATRVIQIYQNQLISLFKRASIQSTTALPDMLIFKSKLDKQIKRLKEVQDDKSISEDKVSDVCQPMCDYLNNFVRVKNTSQSERYALRSNLRTQDTHRMRLTGGIKRTIHHDAEPISQSVQMDDILRSYKIQQQIGPRMRMKWKSFKNSEQQQKNVQARKIQRSTIGDNNIDLLSYTIPQIQNSIKRLSLQSGYSKQRSPQKIFESYRTVDTRSNNRKKYVPRLI